MHSREAGREHGHTSVDIILPSMTSHERDWRPTSGGQGLGGGVWGAESGGRGLGAANAQTRTMTQHSDICKRRHEVFSSGPLLCLCLRATERRGSSGFSFHRDASFGENTLIQSKQSHFPRQLASRKQRTYYTSGLFLVMQIKQSAHISFTQATALEFFTFLPDSSSHSYVHISHTLMYVH